MIRDLAPSTIAPGPFDRAIQPVAVVVVYLGGLALLAATSIRALARPNVEASPLRLGLVRHWAWLFGAGLPLVGLVHVGLGSFLAMQAYYGATFVEGVGPIVGVGLCRNVAPMMTGLIMAGLLAARITPDLRRRPLVDRDGDPTLPPDSARLAGVAIAAAALGGPILAFWATVIGTLSGGQCADTLINVPPPIYYSEMFKMLWARDAVGLIVKGAAFGWVAALFAVFEGLRGPAEPDPEAVPAAAARAASFACVAILALNGVWYLLMYMAGPAFGPTVLAPPVP